MISCTYLRGNKFNMSKQFLLILAAIVVVFGGLLVFNKRDNGTDNGSTNGGTQDVSLTNHITKEGTTNVRLVEYGDFQCPSCGQYYPLFKELKQKYEGKVTFQFRHFPLVEIHQNALISARAAEAAAMQNKFWEMHDLLFENQNSWSTSSNPSAIFEGYAEQLGLDVEKFKSDMRSEQTNQLVQADRREAQRKGYQSAPTFELNGEKIENVTSVEAFSEKIDEAIKQSNKQ